MTLEPLPLEGAYLVHGNRMLDERGWFWKTYLDTEFNKLGLNFECRETFFSCSVTGVLRGLHFQGPPNASAKLVTCLDGAILDVAVDIRASSPTYGHVSYVELGGSKATSLYLPAGFAHGFYVRKGPAILAYQTNIPYDAELDSGIRWNTMPITWPISDDNGPIVSQRDDSLIEWPSFKTPFK